MDVGPMTNLRIRNGMEEMAPRNCSHTNNDMEDCVGDRLQATPRLRRASVTTRSSAKTRLCYLILISLLSSSPSSLQCASAQDIIVGKPFPSPSPSSEPQVPQMSVAAGAVAVMSKGSPRPRLVSQNEWTPMPSPTNLISNSNNNDKNNNNKDDAKVTTTTAVPPAEVNRPKRDEAQTAESKKDSKNESQNKNSNQDLTSAATHYVGRQATDPGFFNTRNSKNYAFAYGADDFTHQEKRDGKVTTGEYTVALPDGRTQVVRYTSDSKAGFKADVSYEGEPIKEAQEPYQGQNQKSYSIPSKSSSNYLNQPSIISPSISPVPQHQISTPYSEHNYIGPSPTPIYRQTRIKLNGNGNPGPSQSPLSYGPSQSPPSYGPSQSPPSYGPSQSPPSYGPSQSPPSYGPSQSPPSYSPSQSPIYLSYPIKAQRPSLRPSLLYSNKNQNSNSNVQIIDHHHYFDQHGNKLSPSAGTPTATPPSTIYESDPNYLQEQDTISNPGPYILQSSPSVETINRGTPLQFYPSPAPSQSPSPDPSPNSLYFESGPTKITTILQRANSNSKIISHGNSSPQYTSLPTAPSPSEDPSPYKHIPRGFRAGPGPEPEFITHSHYTKPSGGSYSKSGSKSILIHGPGGSPHPYTEDSSSSNIRYKEVQQQEPLPISPYSHESPPSHRSPPRDYSVGSSRRSHGRSKTSGKTKSNLVPIEFFKAGPATKSPVAADEPYLGHRLRGGALLQEQSISQKQVYSPNTVISNNHIVSTYSPPVAVVSQGQQELEPQAYFEPQDAIDSQRIQLQKVSKYSPLHPQGEPLPVSSSSSSEEQHHHQYHDQQVIRFAPNPNPNPDPNQHHQYISQVSRPGPQRQTIDVSIAPVKSSVASYTIGHLGVTPKPSLYHSSTDPGIPVGRPIHPSVGGLVYLESPTNPIHSIPISPSQYSNSNPDELPDAGPTTRPTPKEQRKGVKEALSRLPYIPPFPPKTSTYKVGAPDFGDSVSYSSKPSSGEESEDLQHHHHHHHHHTHSEEGPKESVEPLLIDPQQYQHVQDLPSNQLSPQLSRKYYLQKTIRGGEPNYVDSA